MSFPASQGVEEPVGFELSEDGKTFYPASATIVSDGEIAVWDYGIPEPAFIRYGYNPAFTGTVTDGRGVPLGIFATDAFLFDFLYEFILYVSLL